MLEDLNDGNTIDEVVGFGEVCLEKREARAR